MSTDQSYEDTAQFYDGAYGDSSLARGDEAFYENLAIESGGPVLELGCGTGRALLPIASQGIDCSGIDLSPAMLEQFRQKRKASTVRLSCASMDAFDLGERRFKLIFSAFRAFQHLDTVEQQLACLSSVRAHLEPCGVFAFDVFNPRLERMAVDAEPELLDTSFTNERNEVKRYVSVTRHRVKQLIYVTFRYVEESATGPVKETKVNFTMRWFWRYELEHLLSRAGFTDVAIYGDFDRSPVGPDSSDLIVVAR